MDEVEITAPEPADAGERIALAGAGVLVAALAAAGVLGWAAYGERILVNALANGWAACF